MRVVYDKEADAAYITLVREIKPGESAQQVSFIDTPNGVSQVTLDFDVEGHLLGLEILTASRALREEVLRRALPE